MIRERKSIHGQWSSRWAFILAATGSAVGLGNIWKFPYITGENGGGAFVLVYLGCIALIGIPIMVAEVMLGRRGRQSPINTMEALAEESGRSCLWQLLGTAGMIAGFLILSYYSVIAGWALAYVFRTASGMFYDVTADGAASIFSTFVSNPEGLLAWHTIFMAMTMVVVSRGVRSGLEQAVRFLMPGLVLILIVLVGFSMSSGKFMDGVNFLFRPNFHELSGESVLIAMGHSFFTLSLGMGAIMMYGSYLPARTSIARTSITIAVADTAVALLAGLAIFPIVFANDLTPGQGPGLIFQTLPVAFGHMPGGALFGTLFFVLLVLAAWTSSISLVEPAVAWLVENHAVTRIHAAVGVGVAVWLLGIGTIFSFNRWAEYQFLGKTFFDILDFLTANIMLPTGGLLIAIFAGWLMTREASQHELGMREMYYRVWREVIRYVTPVGVAVVFLHVLGIIGWGE